MSTDKTILSVQNLGVTLDGEEFLKNINFTLNHGEVLAFIGPNGSGKSVLVRTLLGLLPHTGTFKWKDGLKVGYVPQHFSVDRELPLNVKEFLQFKEKRIDKLILVLKSVGVIAPDADEHHVEYHILRQRMGYLSGGQLQRVLIAWSLLDKPDVLIYDEPTSGVDIGGEETIYNLLRRLHNQHQMTIILVSHELNIVYKYATTVICVNKEMVCYGPPHDALDPQALARLYGGEAGFYRHAHAKNEEESEHAHE